MAAHVLAPAATTPDKTALRVLADADGAVVETATFAALDRQIRSLAAGLRAAGLAPGDRVFLRLRNSADFPRLFFATIAAGAVAVPTSAALTAVEAERL
ncbi:MAG: AMP-binding protein, partial [Pseudomonadota bacterium]